MPPEHLTAGTYESQTTSTGYGIASGPRAGFWQRFAASVVDAVVLVIPNLILETVFKGAGFALSILVGGVYFTYFVGAARGQTPGERALGIRVVSLANGNSIGHGRAFIRWIGSYVSAVVLLLGYLWMLWDEEKQCWHDKFASAVVVPVSAYPPPS
jgi:uncharacterized RDD family membrane protein YckC